MEEEDDDVQERWCVAYHEAWHAVVALKFGRTIDTVELYDDGGGICGICRHFGSLAAGNPIGKLAGRLGEELYTGQPREVSDDELRSVIRQLRDGEDLGDDDDASILKDALLLDPSATDDELIETYRDYEQEAQRVVSDPELSAKVERIAEHLFFKGRLNGETVRLLALTSEEAEEEVALGLLTEEAVADVIQ